MTAQDIKDLVEEKCRLIDKVEAENPGLRVFGVNVDDLPIATLQKYAEITGQEMKYQKESKTMRVHYSSNPYCVFLSSVPVVVETVIKEVEK